MGKYYKIYEEGDVDDILVGESDDMDEAFEIARDCWDRMTSHDRQHNRVRVLHFLYDIDDEDCTCFDCDSYDWFVKYAGYRGPEDLKPALISFDWYEVYGAVRDYPEGYIESYDYRTGDVLESNEVQDLRYMMELYI